MNSNSGQYCFTHTTAQEVYLFVLRNKKGTEVTVTNFGAIITSFKIKKKDGSFNDIVLGFHKVRDYLAEDYLKQYPWFGCAVGRYANRIKEATFELEGKRYLLAKNHGEETLHGGETGFDRRVWEFAGEGSTPHPWLELRYSSADGEEGFPGKLDVTIRFELTDNNELSYTYTAQSDKATIINLTHHDYFNLDNEQGTIHEQEIKIYSSQILEQDKNLVVTGHIIPIENTAFDFSEFKSIGEGLAAIDEYDKSFVVAKRADLLVAEARSKKSGILLQVYSTDPVVHFYSGKWIPVVKGKNETIYGPFSGFCLETHVHPNAINIPHFPNTILRQGETYHQKTTYKVNQVSEK